MTFSGYCNDDGLTLGERQRGRKKKDREGERRKTEKERKWVIQMKRESNTVGED